MEIFTLKNRKGLKIVGNLSIPENPIGLVFVLHGLGGFKEQKQVILTADTFFKHNYLVVNFDATNSKGESGGNYENATMQAHYEDLIDVINWADKQDWSKQPFIVSGFSMGGYAAAQFAEDHSEIVKAVFLEAPVVSGSLSFEASNRFKVEELKEWEETGWQTRRSVSKPDMVLRLPWSHMEERLKHDLRSKASSLTMPVCIVVGEKDESCPPDHQKILYDLIPGKKEMHVVPGAAHTFRTDEHLEQLKEILENWLKNLI